MRLLNFQYDILTDRFLPDKAIDVVDEAGAYQHLNQNQNVKRLLGVVKLKR